ncbi:MAG: hypothetical protein WA628_22200 [Terriglobales bacterium]
MTVPRWLFNYLWIAPHALQVVLAIMMIHRKLAKTFPAFFTYTIFEIVQFLILFTIDKSPLFTADQYSMASLAGGAISIALRFAVVHEIFSTVFRSYPALQAFGTVLFRWATALLMIVAVILVGYTSGNEMDRYRIAYVVIDRAVSIVQCGLLVLLLLLARFLRFPWTSFVFGIALGLGLFASMELGLSALQAQYGLYVAWGILPSVTMAIYHCCVVFWVVSLLLPERQPGRMNEASGYELEHWNDALERLLHQ